MKIKTKNSLTEEIRGVTWELPLITAITYVSTLKGSGGQKFPKMCLHIVLKMLTRGRSKISKKTYKIWESPPPNTIVHKYWKSPNLKTPSLGSKQIYIGFSKNFHKWIKTFFKDQEMRQTSEVIISYERIHKCRKGYLSNDHTYPRLFYMHKY